jgi:hypothetical protein
MTDPQRTASAATHAGHDLSIVAELAARGADIDEGAAAAARSQVAACESCADVLADLSALQSSLPQTATPKRPRDFQLTPGDAQRLHRSGWRRVLGYFGSPRDGFSRPLAIGLTTLGLAGILLASIPSPTFMATGGAAPATEAAPIQQAAPAPGAEGYSSERTSLGAAAAVSAAPSGAASASSDGQVFTGGNPDELAAESTGAVDVAIRDDVTGFSTLFVVGGILLITGLGLFLIRWSARRLS